MRHKRQHNARRGVAPVRERGLKYAYPEKCLAVRKVAPVRERGLKSALLQGMEVMGSRSREGAWIEIIVRVCNIDVQKVAPVRERGLKYLVVKREINGVTVAPVRERGLK